MKNWLTKEPRAQLHIFAKQVIAKNTDAHEAKRKFPKPTRDMNVDDGPSTAVSSASGARRVTFRTTSGLPPWSVFPAAAALRHLALPPTRTST